MTTTKNIEDIFAQHVAAVTVAYQHLLSRLTWTQKDFMPNNTRQLFRPYENSVVERLLPQKMTDVNRFQEFARAINDLEVHVDTAIDCGVTAYQGWNGDDFTNEEPFKELYVANELLQQLQEAVHLEPLLSYAKILKADTSAEPSLSEQQQKQLSRAANHFLNRFKKDEWYIRRGSEPFAYGSVYWEDHKNSDPETLLDLYRPLIVKQRSY